MLSRDPCCCNSLEIQSNFKNLKLAEIRIELSSSTQTQYEALSLLLSLQPRVELGLNDANYFKIRFY